MFGASDRLSAMEIVWMTLNPQGRICFAVAPLSSKKHCPRKQEYYFLQLFLTPVWAQSLVLLICE